MATETKLKTKKYQLWASERSAPPDVIAVFDTQREARRYLTSVAARMGHKRLHRDMWSNGESVMYIKPLHTENVA